MMLKLEEASSGISWVLEVGKPSCGEVQIQHAMHIHLHIHIHVLTELFTRQTWKAFLKCLVWVAM